MIYRRIGDRVDEIEFLPDPAPTDLQSRIESIDVMFESMDTLITDLGKMAHCLAWTKDIAKHLYHSIAVSRKVMLLDGMTLDELNASVLKARENLSAELGELKFSKNRWMLVYTENIGYIFEEMNKDRKPKGDKPLDEKIIRGIAIMYEWLDSGAI